MWYTQTMGKKADKPKRTASFVATFEVLAEAAGCRQLEQMRNAYRQLYNATLGDLQRRLRRARTAPEWAAARLLPKDSEERRQAFGRVRQQWGLSAAGAQKTADRFCVGHFQKQTNSRVVQQVAKRAWQATERVMFGKAKRVRFKGREDFTSFGGNDNQTGVVVSVGTGTVRVGKLVLAFAADSGNPYHVHALQHRVKYSRIIKRMINGVSRWYVQMVLEGTPYRDPQHVTQAGERVGLDLGPAKIAVATASDSFQQPFCPGLKQKQAEIRRLQRRLERSRRAANPEHYHPNGTVKKGRKVWRQSTRYRNLRTRLANLERRKSAQRTSLHGQLAHRILTFGNQLHLEQVSYKAWQKWYGKAVGQQAPSGFVTHLIRLAATHGGGASLINTFQTGLSQLCLCGARRKKSLAERTHSCPDCGFTAPRDEWSAFLALHTGCSNGTWVTDLSGVALGLQSHRTLRPGRDHHPGPGAVAVAVVENDKLRAVGPGSTHGVPPAVRGVRTRAGERNLEPPVGDNGCGSGCR